MGRSTPAQLPAWLDLDERKALRLPLGLNVIAESDLTGEIAVTMVDISTLGALLKTPIKLKIGTFFILKIDNAIEYGGWIAWAKADCAGLDFANAMPEPVVERLSASSSVALARRLR